MEISESKLKEYLEELKTLKHDIPVLTKRKQEARAEGDLSENTEYDEASQELEKAMSRKSYLESIIANAIVISSVESNGRITIGSYVKIECKSHPDVGQRVLRVDQNGITVNKDPLKRILSVGSRLGAAILNSVSGEYKIQTERGEMVYQVTLITLDEAKRLVGAA